MALRAEDLMVYDLVFDKVNKRVVQVCEVSDDGYIFNHFSQVLNLDEIEPIPLTDEIMAKNFSQYSESCEPNFSKDYLITDIGATITYDVVTRLIGLPVRNIAGDWEFYSITEIRYVHQLQHALRMLNIEKEMII